MNPSNRFWIAPAVDPSNRHAAGYDANQFASRDEAVAAIAGLRQLGGPEWDIDWIVNEDSNVTGVEWGLSAKVAHAVSSATDEARRAWESAAAAACIISPKACDDIRAGLRGARRALDHLETVLNARRGAQ